MNDRKAIELAEKIVKLDLVRDEAWEKLMEVAGNRAFELLRRIQNG